MLKTGELHYYNTTTTIIKKEDINHCYTFILLAGMRAIATAAVTPATH
jgi:hypothetical protein